MTLTTAPTTDPRWVTVARLEDLPDGQIKAIRCDGRVVAVVRLGDTVCALENACPHRGGPLAGGRLVGGEIACPWHGFRFDPRTGAATMPAQHPPASLVPARVQGGKVQLGAVAQTAASPTGEE